MRKRTREQLDRLEWHVDSLSLDLKNAYDILRGLEQTPDRWRIVLKTGGHLEYAGKRSLDHPADHFVLTDERGNVTIDIPWANVNFVRRADAA